MENRIKNFQRRYVENILLLAKKLRELRQRLGWTQPYLAAETRREGVIPLSVRQIRRAENGEKGVSIGCYHRLAHALGTTLDELLEAESEAFKWWNLPYPYNPFFTGRDDVLKQLHETFSSGKSSRAVLTQPQVISGLGGIGKTQTAVEYAHRYYDDYKAGLWTKADSQESLISGFVSIAKLLDLSEQNAEEQNLVVMAVKHWLETNNSWLLIFDNADEPKFVESFIPKKPKGHILLTSRASAFQHLGITHTIRLEKMTPTEAKEFLLKRTGRNFESSNLKEIEAINQIASELDYLPLALEQAAAYVTQLESNFQSYLSSFCIRGLKLLEKTGVVTDKYPFSVATTWALNFKQVEQKSQAAADLLRISAFLHPDQIPLELLTLGAKESGSVLSKALSKADNDPLILDEVLEPLAKYSLIQRDSSSQTYSIHRLVQAVLKERMSYKEQRQWAECVIRALNAAFPYADFPNWHLCERLLPQAQTCAEYIEKYGFESEAAARLLNQVGRYMHDRRLSEAELPLKKALVIRKNLFGLNHLNTAQSFYDLGCLYHSQGKLAETERFYKRVLEIREKTLGPSHPDVARILGSLGRLYQVQGRMVEAERFYKRALEIREKSIGLNHPDTAHNLINLGSIHHDQGKYRKAEPFYQQALAILEKRLNTNHPDIALNLTYLGKLYLRSG